MVKTWGDHILKRRLESALDQHEVAKLLGCDTTTVHNWERNLSQPQLRLIPRIVEFLGYEPPFVQPATLGEKLLEYRKARGITQKELACKIGIDPTTLSRLERNQGKRFFQNVLKKVNDFLREHS